MIKFDRFVLSNGLKVLVHQDQSTPMAVVNVLYDVGARDEVESKTGFAHLFEHLMFGGSINIPEYDEPLQLAGGENNAYTTNDLTNYYCQLPAENLETAFWLESDRMLSLAFSKKSLDVQRKVVCEEFKEHYINKPYGDVWHIMRDLAYKVHPYKWMTIGKELSHIENAQLDDVKHFFFKHYTPSNAILVVAGNVETAHVRQLAEKWFGGIPSGEKYIRSIAEEPMQNEERRITLKRNVPMDAIYKTWHMSSRFDPDYYVTDLLTDILGGGASSRLYQTLVKEKQLFAHINCYHFGSLDRGLFTIEGQLVKGIDFKLAEEAIELELNKVREQLVDERELEKVKNKTESVMAFEDMSVMNRAGSLAFYELLGDGDLMNEEFKKYQLVTTADLQRVAKEVLRDTNSNTIWYLAN
ncbi:MAG: M16 family metallopeptidase, partial [Chitinophagaceae bacterium]